MDKIPRNDYTFCFNAANAFLDIGQYADHLDKTAANAAILFVGDAFYALPAIVNATFACELYLKVLNSVAADAPERKVHKLTELFSSLPEDCKNRLREAFCKEVHGRVSLDETLEIHSNAFVEWRYPYEPRDHIIEAYPGNLFAAAEVFRQEILNHRL